MRLSFGVQVLQHDREALPNTDADGGDPHRWPSSRKTFASVPRIRPPMRPGMPDGDCAATDVHDVRIDTPGVDARQALHGERLVELHRTDLAQAIPARRSAISAASTGA